MRAHCYRIRRRLAAGQTPRQMPASLREHLGRCERCRYEEQAFASLRTALVEMGSGEATSVEWESVRSRLGERAETTSAERLRVRLSPAWGACAAAALLAALWLLGPRALDTGRVRQADGPRPGAPAVAPTPGPNPGVNPTPQPPAPKPLMATIAQPKERSAPHHRRATVRARVAESANKRQSQRAVVAAQQPPKPKEHSAPQMIVTGSVEHVLPAAHSAAYSPDVDYVMDEVTPVATPVAVRL